MKYLIALIAILLSVSVFSQTTQQQIVVSIEAYVPFQEQVFDFYDMHELKFMSSEAYIWVETDTLEFEKFDVSLESAIIGMCMDVLMVQTEEIFLRGIVDFGTGVYTIYEATINGYNYVRPR